MNGDRGASGPRRAADNTREAPIAISPEGFRELGHGLVDRIADFMTGLPHGPVTRDESPLSLRALLPQSEGVPERGSDPGALLAATAELLFEHSLFNGHPRFLGYVTAAPAPLGILGDFLASAVNANVGSYRLAPLATEIEAQTLRWLADLVGCSEHAGGLLVSGGNMANIVGLLTARRAAASWDVRELGVRPPGAPRLRIYATRETHTWIQKAVDISGLGGESINWIATDDQQRMLPAALRGALEEDLARGELPMAVVATAGTVSTGAVDPLHEISEISRHAGVWLHVDGCYGGFAAAVPGAPLALSGLKLSDSLALDPHKWLYAPLEAGALLVRSSERLRNAFAYHPPYYHFGQEALNYVDLGPQNSRGFRALKVWLTLRQVGREGYAKMIGDDIALSEWLAAKVSEHAELELFTQSLSITTFRYVPPDIRERLPSESEREAYLDELNQKLLDRIQRSGQTFVSNAVVRGRYLLRACIVNFRTAQSDLAALLAVVSSLGRELDG